jgi:mannose-1-phosphate guanylyltransferase
VAVVAFNAPKQFLPLTGQVSLFQETLKRVSDPSRYAAPIVITMPSIASSSPSRPRRSASSSPAFCLSL